MIEPCYIVSEKSHPKGINWVPVVILDLTLKLKPIAFKLPKDKDHIQKIYLLQLEASETSHFKLQGKLYDKCRKKSPGGFFRGFINSLNVNLNL